MKKKPQNVSYEDAFCLPEEALSRMEEKIARLKRLIVSLEKDLWQAQAGNDGILR